MQVTLSQSFPTKKENILVVLFLTKNNITESNEWCDSDFSQIIFDESHTEVGKKTLIPAGTMMLCAMGLGEKISAESIRKSTHRAIGLANEYQYASLLIVFPKELSETRATAIAESAVLSNYQFLTYKSDKKTNSLNQLFIWGKGEKLQDAVNYGCDVAEVTCITRDLVNEPVMTLTAEEFSQRMARLGNEYGFSVEIFNKTKIQSLRMGGLLAVNLGSKLPPTFTVMEYKPQHPINEKPIIFVGKGVVYDTGGLSLKPTPNSMDFMKSDMAGAGAVVGAMCGIAKLALNVHVIGLVPATDNRPGENAYTPGDVITMYDGTSVEVLNTDAEGRLILADALAYAKQYQPELVIDLATLTGACVVAIGSVGLGMMSTADDTIKNAFKASGETVYERLVEFPLWDEYGEMIKSDIADLKNLGGAGAGTITAGKFLQHFTDYPWIHLDIAGAAYLSAPDSYRGKNGTGTGVRLLIDYIKTRGSK